MLQNARSHPHHSLNLQLSNYRFTALPLFLLTVDYIYVMLQRLLHFLDRCHPFCDRPTQLQRVALEGSALQ